MASVNEECNQVLLEYLELFNCIGYRYKYYLAPNAVLDWLGIRHIRGSPNIHEFLIKKFNSEQSKHLNFYTGNECGPIENNFYQMKTKILPTQEVEIINSKNRISGISSLKTRAESDIESDNEMSTETTTTTTITTPSEAVSNIPTSSSVTKRLETGYDSDESVDYNVKSCKRKKYNTPPSTPFKYLRRLPKKAPYTRMCSTSDEDSSDDDIEYKSHQIVKSSDYSTLRYFEAYGTLRRKESDDGFVENPIRLRISYRRNLKTKTIQFALIIYERQNEKAMPKRCNRLLDFSKCIDNDDISTPEEWESIDTQPAVVLTTKDGETHEMIATVSTPSSTEIATALEEAAFTIQPPVQRTPTKSTPVISPGTPKRKPRTSMMGMSGLAPLGLSSLKKPLRAQANTPKLKAARNLRL